MNEQNQRVSSVVLCGETLPVVPQKIGRLKHKLNAEDLQRVLSPNFDEESYRVLSVLIPALEERVPRWKWEGYGSADAAERDEYVESHDMSPTTDEVIGAFQEALMVGGARRLGKIAGLLSLAAQTSASTSPASPVSVGSNGASASTPSTTPPPTSTES